MQESRRRIPWCREIFLTLQAVCVHPIRWSDGKFQPSGLLFSILRNLVVLVIIVAAVVNFLEPDLTDKDESEDNPIYRELHTFALIIRMSSDMLIALLIFGLNHRRDRIANVFNQLEHLWVW